MSEFSALPPESEDRPALIYPDELFDQIWEEDKSAVEDTILSGADYEYRRRYSKFSKLEGELTSVEDLCMIIQAGKQADSRLEQYGEEADQADYWRVLSKAGLNARNKLAVSSLRFAAWFVRETMDVRKKEREEEFEPGRRGAIVNDLSTLSGGELGYDDRLQIASIGLLKAAERHNPDLGSFTTYAMWHLESELLRAIFNYQSPISLPQSASEVLKKFRKIYKEVEDQSIGTPEYEDLAYVLECETEYAVYLNELRHVNQPVSLEQIEDYWLENKFAESDLEMVSDAEKLTLADILPDPGVDYSVFDEAAIVEIGRKLDEVLSSRPERDQIIIEQRTGLDSGKIATYDEIGDTLGLNRTRVGQLYFRAIALIRSNFFDALFELNINEDPSFGMRSQVPLTVEDDLVLGLDRAQKNRSPTYMQQSFFGHSKKAIHSRELRRRAYTLDEFQEMRDQASEGKSKQ